MDIVKYEHHKLIDSLNKQNPVLFGGTFGAYSLIIEYYKGIIPISIFDDKGMSEVEISQDKFIKAIDVGGLHHLLCEIFHTHFKTWDEHRSKPNEEPKIEWSTEDQLKYEMEKRNEIENL